MISKSKAFFYFEAELIVTLKLCDRKRRLFASLFYTEVVKLLFIDFLFKIFPLKINSYLSFTLLQTAAAHIPKLSAANNSLDRYEPRVQLLGELSHRLMRILVGVRVDVGLVGGEGVEERHGAVSVGMHNS